MQSIYKIHFANEMAERVVTEDEFSRIAKHGMHFVFRAETLHCLYPYTGRFTKYRYTDAGDRERCFEKGTFFALLRKERTYRKSCKERAAVYHPNFYWFEDEESGLVTMLAPTPGNKEVAAFNRCHRDNIAKQRERDTRCRLDDGTVCHQSCGGCERQGERQSILVSLDLLANDGYDIADTLDGVTKLESAALLEVLRRSLGDEEFGLVEALMSGHSLRSYVSELAETMHGIREGTLYQRLYRLKPRALAKAEAVLNAWQESV